MARTATIKKSDLEDLLTVEELAPKIGMSAGTIRNRIYVNKDFPIPYIQTSGPRFRPSAVKAYLDKREIKQAS